MFDGECIFDDARDRLAGTHDLRHIDPKLLLRKTPVDMRSVISNRDELVGWFKGSEFEDVVTRSLEG